MSKENTYACSGGAKLIFACSGAADVGAIADQAARKMTKEGIGKMFCSAGIGGRVSGIMKTAESADKILAIDGCPLNCVKNSLDLAGFKDFDHLQLADLGLEKGSSPATENNIDKVVSKGKELIVSNC
ncbi:MAG: putative zinc-binding protein [Phycisphaerae bacterium]|nr:putative zinc-binding protein [Phycisphaerae bacterium]